MEHVAGRLASVQVGWPRNLESHGKEWRSAIFKEEIEGRILLGSTNLEGDRQANLRFHGGPDKAVCCFPAEHFEFWRDRLGREGEFRHGAFGENFTLENLTEAQVCIGDTFTVGSAVVQVTQPRQPCINLARKWDSEEMPEKMIATGHTGYYLRVLTAGEIGAGDECLLTARPNPAFTVAAANDILYRKVGGENARLSLRDLPELSAEWKRVLGRAKG